MSIFLRFSIQIPHTAAKISRPANDINKPHSLQITNFPSRNKLGKIYYFAIRKEFKSLTLLKTSLLVYFLFHFFRLFWKDNFLSIFSDFFRRLLRGFNYKGFKPFKTYILNRFLFLFDLCLPPCPFSFPFLFYYLFLLVLQLFSESDIFNLCPFFLFGSLDFLRNILLNFVEGKHLRGSNVFEKIVINFVVGMVEPGFGGSGSWVGHKNNEEGNWIAIIFKVYW